jgi:hypothetical protein
MYTLAETIDDILPYKTILDYKCLTLQKLPRFDMILPHLIALLMPCVQ